MAKPGFVTQVTGFQIEPDGYIYRDHSDAVAAAASRAIYMAYFDDAGEPVDRGDADPGDEAYTFVSENSEMFAAVLLSNRALIRGLLKV